MVVGFRTRAFGLRQVCQALSHIVPVAESSGVEEVDAYRDVHVRRPGDRGCDVHEPLSERSCLSPKALNPKTLQFPSAQLHPKP